ncbi:MAG: hypothetical protein L6Q77_07755 [Bacteroidetes bacterium]|nr:hypothetical protein [Bacteroidota bacterium]
MRILVLTDSLGLPRSFPAVVKVENTWVNQLTQHHEVVAFSYGGGTIDQLFSQVEYLKLYNPDFVLIQAGIVDCAPRALSKIENIIINNYNITKRIFSKIFSESDLVALRRVRKKTYTPLNKFEYFVDRFIQQFGSRLYWIGILPPLQGYEKKVPGITKNVAQYNRLLEVKLGSRFISTNNFTKNDIMTDFIHLTEKGNGNLVKLILERLNVK